MEIRTKLFSVVHWAEQPRPRRSLSVVPNQNVWHLILFVSKDADRRLPYLNTYENK